MCVHVRAPGDVGFHHAEADLLVALGKLGKRTPHQFCVIGIVPDVTGPSRQQALQAIADPALFPQQLLGGCGQVNQLGNHGGDSGGGGTEPPPQCRIDSATWSLARPYQP